MHALPVKFKSRSLDQFRSLGHRETERDGFVNLPFSVIRDEDFEARHPVCRCRRHDSYIHPVVAAGINDVPAVIRSIAARYARSRDIEGNRHASGRNGENPGGVKQDSVWRPLNSRRFGRGEFDGLRVRGNMNGVLGLAQRNVVAAGCERTIGTVQREFNGLVGFVHPVGKDGEINLLGESLSEFSRLEVNAILPAGKRLIVRPALGGPGRFFDNDINVKSHSRRNVQADGDSVYARYYCGFFKPGTASCTTFNFGTAPNEFDHGVIVVEDGEGVRAFGGVHASPTGRKRITLRKRDGNIVVGLVDSVVIDQDNDFVTRTARRNGERTALGEGDEVVPVAGSCLEPQRQPVCGGGIVESDREDRLAAVLPDLALPVVIGEEGRIAVGKDGDHMPPAVHDDPLRQPNVRQVEDDGFGRFGGSGLVIIDGCNQEGRIIVPCGRDGHYKRIRDGKTGVIHVGVQVGRAGDIKGKRLAAVRNPVIREPESNFNLFTFPHLGRRLRKTDGGRSRVVVGDGDDTAGIEAGQRPSIRQRECLEFQSEGLTVCIPVAVGTNAERRGAFPARNGERLGRLVPTRPADTYNVIIARIGGGTAGILSQG